MSRRLKSGRQLLAADRVIFIFFLCPLDGVRFKSFLHGAFLRAAEIWDVRIGVYNIRSMVGNAIMNGETRHLTEKEAVRTVECWGPIPQETTMRSFYLQCMRFFAKCQCAKGKMFRLFPWRALFGGCEERESRLLYAAVREKGRSGCFQSAPAH